MKSLLWAAMGTGFTFIMTSLGSALVFIFRRKVNAKFHRVLLGFAAGVMIAASVWSLLIPAIEETKNSGGIGWIPAAGGFIFGMVFLIILDTLLPHFHMGSNKTEGLPSPWKRTTLLFLTITLHNIPEGMAVGLSFALAAKHGGDSAMFAAATALSIGIGIQNLPEGAAISLPLRHEGMPAVKAFLYGSMSAIVEPVFGILVVLAAGAVQPLMPWLLSFAAGAMIYVAVKELIPEANFGDNSKMGTLGVMGGFLLMMILDVALG